jgi:hypothetical protein
VLLEVSKFLIQIGRLPIEWRLNRVTCHDNDTMKTNLSGHTHKIVLLVFRSVFILPSDCLSTSYIRPQLRQNVSGVMSCLMHAGI